MPPPASKTFSPSSPPPSPPCAWAAPAPPPPRKPPAPFPPPPPAPPPLLPLPPPPKPPPPPPPPPLSTCHHASERAKPALSFEICPCRGWQPSMRMYGHALCRVTKWMVEAGLLAGLMLQLGGRGTDGRRALPRGLGHHLAPVQHVGGRRCCVHRIGGVATPRFVHLALDSSVDGRSLAIWLAPWASGERAAAIRRLCWWHRPVAMLLAC